MELELKKDFKDARKRWDMYWAGECTDRPVLRVVHAKPEAAENPCPHRYNLLGSDPDEFAGGSFKTAINIPVDTLEEKIKTMPADKPIVFVCNTGARSGESYYMVQDVRPGLTSVYYLEAELTFSKDGSVKITQPAS